jgi:probable blue pigment (indigoidine) exporter
MKCLFVRHPYAGWIVDGVKPVEYRTMQTKIRVVELGELTKKLQLIKSGVKPGERVVFVGAAFWALYTVLSNRTIKRIGGLRYSAWSLLFAGLWILLFQLMTGHPVRVPLEWQDTLCLLYLGLIPSALAFFSWNNAQRYISTGLLAMSGYFTPILTALLGWMLFGETVTFMQCLGMVLVFGSALIEPEIAAMIRFPRRHHPS